ncbi:insulin-like growth factor-binding protein complex acid labile subunit [Haliotis rubra]|uniref:insulin-like growth factor-binding protein complex acid labile subunit n=1 Tax=Haliotis rubra TaxID=36100 RepID=UPI001EE5E871|nr:insulin-like growth factor-binding protein complex acid labile subunit [Haliotis rubra]
MMSVTIYSLVWIVIPNLMTSLCHPQHSDIEKCNIHHEANETTVDCSRRGFNRVPQGVPRNTTVLNMGNNNLSNLRKGSLPNLPSLHTLLANDNNIEFLEEGALQSLPVLQQLNLDGNKLNFSYFSLPLGTFQNLTSLTTLHVSRMRMPFTSLTYPDATFADLHHLESLVIDGAGEPVFGPGFAQMRRLKSLSFGSQCLIRRLGKNSFVNFREAPVRDLSLSACSILIFLDANVFFPLHKLKFLFARDTAPFGLYESFLSLQGLSGRNMTEIDFSLVRTYPVSVQGVMKNQSLVLTSEMTRYLKTMCVERLILRNNYIVVIETGVLLQEPFQSCIKYLDISYNSIKGVPRTTGTINP